MMSLWAELPKAKQTSSVVDFQEAFDRRMTRLHLDPSHAIRMFLEGLKPELGDVVRLHRTYSLPQAYHLARIQESVFQKQDKAMKWSAGHASHVQPVTNPTTHWPKTTSPIMDDRSTRRRLTPTELSEKRAKGLFIGEMRNIS